MIGRKRTLALVACSALLAALSVASTLAYYVDFASLTNVFSTGRVSVGLVESDTQVDGDGNPLTNSYVISLDDPDGIAKDPKVTFDAGNSESWIFVQLAESDGFDNLLGYEVAEEWLQLTDSDGKNVDGVYYRLAEQGGATQKFSVLAGDLVTVRPGVTQAQLNALAPGSYPTLTITAYAVQRAGLSSAYGAWQELLAAQG